MKKLCMFFFGVMFSYIPVLYCAESPAGQQQQQYQQGQPQYQQGQPQYQQGQPQYQQGQQQYQQGQQQYQQGQQQYQQGQQQYQQGQQQYQQGQPQYQQGQQQYQQGQQQYQQGQQQYQQGQQQYQQGQQPQYQVGQDVPKDKKTIGQYIVGQKFFINEGQKFLNLSGADLTIHPDYVLKPDDIVVIDVWGDLDLHYSLKIDKDGSIIIPNVGKVSLRGLAFEQGKKKILNKLADTYGFYIDKNDPGAGKAHLDITLGKISGVKVYLTGEVIHPGVVMLNGANSSVIAAIAAGEGVKDTGSVRNIQITHTDKSKSMFDLYELLFKGKLLPENKYLNDGDIVYVPPIKDKAYVLGALINPGTYEIMSGETVNSLIDTAGGFSNSASKKVIILNIGDDIYIEKQKTEKQEDFSNVANYKVKNNDIILAKEQLNPKPYSYIEVVGKGVRYNGRLRYEKGLTIKDCIEKSGGLYRDAYKTLILQTTNEDGATEFKLLDHFNDKNYQLLPGDKLVIEDSGTFYKSRFAFICGYVENPQILYLTGKEKISDILAIGKPKENADIDNGIFTHDGKTISIALEEIINDPKSEKNINVTGQDVLFLPRAEPYIEVSGAVISPGFYPYSKDRTTSYYIDLAGGFTDFADRSNTVIKTSGKTIKAYSWWGFTDEVVKRGTTIFVPEKRRI